MKGSEPRIAWPFAFQSVSEFPAVSQNNWLWVNIASDIFTIHWMQLIYVSVRNARQIFTTMFYITSEQYVFIKSTFVPDICLLCSYLTLCSMYFIFWWRFLSLTSLVFVLIHPMGVSMCLVTMHGGRRGPVPFVTRGLSRRPVAEINSAGNRLICINNERILTF